MPLEQREEQRAVPAADVDDRLVAAPANRVEPVEPRLPPLLHRPVEGRAFLGMRASHDQNPVPWRSRTSIVPDASSVAIAACQTPPKRCAKSRQPSPRSTSEDGVLAKTRGSRSVKMPSLASARSRR